MSDIEDFASDVLERAKARSKVLKGTLGKAEPLKVTFGAVENVPIPCDDGDDSVEDIKETLDDTEMSNEELESNVYLKESVTDYSNIPVQSAVANLPLNDLNVKMSASPVRRMRLKELASTINGWEDDCTHHVAPTSRFNLNKPQSPQRKLQPLMTSSPKTAVSAVEAKVVRHTVTESCVGGISSELCLHSVTVETQSTVLKEIVELESKQELQGNSSISSHDSSRCDPIDLGEDAICSEGNSIANSELCDSILYVTSQSDIQNNENEKPSGDDGKLKRTTSSQQCLLNESFISALEAQGFVQSPTSSKLVYQYKDTKESTPYQLPGPKKNEPPVKRAASPVRPTPVYSKSPSPTKNSPAVVTDGPPRVMELIKKQFEKEEVIKTTCTAEKIDAQRSKISVAEKAALYESKCKSSAVKEVDPVELSVAERRKLFEGKKNLFQAPAALDAAGISPTKQDNAKSASARRAPRPSMIPAQPLKMKLQMFEKGLKEEPEYSSDSDGESHAQTHESMVTNSAPVCNGQIPPPPPLPAMGSPRRLEVSPRRSIPRRSTRSPTRMSNVSITSDDEPSFLPSPVARSPPRQIVKEVSFADLPKSPKRFSSPSPHGKRSISPKANYPGARDIKRIKVNNPKPGRIYPSLTDIETTETETDTDMDMGTTAEARDYMDDEDLESEASTLSGSSLGTFIERKAIQHSPFRQPEHRVGMRSYEEINASLACQKVDEFIDEALEGQDYSMDTNICESSPMAASSPMKALSSHPSTSTLGGNLVHTVSFYRKQQTMNTASPQITAATPKRVPPIDEEEDALEERTFSYEDEVNQKISKLNAECQAQQRSIAQASKALSLCKATMEFTDSREKVECERVLLIATHKHSALVNEIHRLKTEGILGRKVEVSPTKGDLGPSCRGNMTLHDVAIQLKREFLPQAMQGETVYHFMALVKYRNQLEASSLASVGNGIESSGIKGGVLYFPNSFTMSNLEPDFKVSVEFFVLKTLREFLPHEAKYHIKKEKNKSTPKKLKHDGSKFTHFQPSPAGPDAVQTSKFQAIGSCSIDISTLQRSHWQLERVSNSSPLEGTASFKIQCSAEGGVEHRGFLTMFQDISGYGDWHRRWCKLTPSELTFWMYPEDENDDAEPVGRIMLRSCVTSRVGPVPRDVCARTNTFLLVTTRSPQSGDRDTLVMSCHEEYTAVRHLISADTREERDLWCRQFNRALANLRAWDPHAHSPDDSLF